MEADGDGVERAHADNDAPPKVQEEDQMEVDRNYRDNQQKEEVEQHQDTAAEQEEEEEGSTEGNLFGLCLTNLIYPSLLFLLFFISLVCLCLTTLFAFCSFVVFFQSDLCCDSLNHPPPALPLALLLLLLLQ